MIADALTGAAGAPSGAAGASVVVFDFDGTLVDRDSVIDFALRYCMRRPARWLLLLVCLPLAAVMRFRSLAASASVLLWALTVGGSTRRFVLALREYAKATLPGFAHEEIFAELTRHVSAGDHVVIATGTLPPLVRGLLGARRHHRLPVVGSRLRRKWGGLVAETHCIGRVKVRELERRFGIVSWVSVYTDSFADRSLLSRARNVTLVSPSNRTLRRTQRLLGGGTPLRVLEPRQR
ncbi:MAG: haloacid dehalogenase-like hydrolase [Myxococcales bacterium]